MEKKEIDLIELIKPIWDKRWSIFKFSLLSALIGIFIAFIIPVKYTASSIFISQSSDSKPSGSLGGLAAIAGINIGSFNSSSEIPSSLYPNIIKSIPYRMRILEIPIVWSKGNGSYREYLLQSSGGFFETVKEYTLGLPGKIKSSVVKNEKKLTTENTSIEWLLTEDDYKLIKLLETSLTISINQKDGYITLSAHDTDPVVSAQLAKAAEQELQKRIIEYKIESAKALLDYTNDQLELKQTELYALQDSLALFNDRNQNVVSAYFENRRLRIESEYSRLSAVYTELATQKEQASLQVKRDTPIFSILEPVMIPREKSSPKRTLILMLSILMGILLPSIYYLGKEQMKKVRYLMLSK